MNRDGSRRVAWLAHVLAALAVITAVGSLIVKYPLDHGELTSGLPIVLLLIATLLVGWILAWKRPAVSIGWILLGVALFQTLSGPAVALGLAVRGFAPQVTEWTFFYGGLTYWAWIPVLGLLMTQIPLRFPTGSLPSPRWRWFSRATIAALVLASAGASTFDTRDDLGLGVRNPAHIQWGAAEGPVSGLLLVLLSGAFLGSIGSLLVRYRRSGPVERAQLRWFFWAVSIVVGLLVLGWIENGLFGQDDAPGVAGAVATAIDTVTSISYLLIPLAILFAVLRSGLYAIDRIISRTAAYAIVTLAIVVVYVGVVLVGSLLLPGAPAIGVATATLAAAALFLPLLRVVRRGVDQRFDRSRYDAQQVVERFGERIRSGADPHGAGDDLVTAVQVALRPASVGIWVREPPS